MPLKKELKTGVQPKDMVLSKMTGFPAWPSFVMPPDMIPRAIMRAKKKTTNVCVIFIPDGDYNWMNEKSLESLTPEKLQTRLGKLPKDKLRARAKKKSGRTNNVADALVAANGLDFDNFMEELTRQNKADEDIEEAGEAGAEEADAEEGEGEEGEDVEDEDEVEDEIEDDEADEAKAEDAEAEGSPSGDEPSEIADDHIDESSDDKNTRVSTDDEAKENGTPGRKRARNGLGARKEAKNAHQSHANGDKIGALKPASEKDRQHQLWLCRIKLQRSLIQRNQPVTPKDPRDYPAPTVDELLVARIILHRLADFPVTVELLRETKIHKVLKCILKDEDLEYPDSFQLHEKCEELLQKWKALIESLKQEKQAKLESRLSSQVPEEPQLLSDNL